MLWGFSVRLTFLPLKNSVARKHRQQGDRDLKIGHHNVEE